jgi:flavorubredoxin
MVLLDKYVKELETDVVLDELNLKEAALMLPARKAKWVSRLIQEKNALNELHRKRSKVLSEVVEEIRKESAIKLATPTLEKAAERHPTIIEITNEIDERRNVIDFLERVEKTMHSIGFDIKNLIEIIKMETT